MQLCNGSDNEYSNARFHSVYLVDKKTLLTNKLNVLNMSAENEARKKAAWQKEMIWKQN